MSHKGTELLERLKAKRRGNNICLVMIVRNEEKIIRRMLDSLQNIVHMVSIVDTGSTDSTEKKILEWSKASKIPTKVHHEPFQNFGYNRTHSLKMAKEVFPEAGWFLLSDADFTWEGSGFPNPLLMNADYYEILQYHGSFSYWNTRVLRADLDWSCNGVTHEVWQPADLKATRKLARMSTLRIHDVSDGGCKGDKSERDKRLLTNALADPAIDDGLRVRYMFYLAQTLRDMQCFKESSEWYQKRIDAGGYEQEVFYAMYCMAMNTENLARRAQKGTDERTRLMTESKERYMAAYKYRPTRAEPLVKLAKLHLDLFEHEECLKICELGSKIKHPTAEGLFIEGECYDYEFDMAISIAAAYLADKKRTLGEPALLRLLERQDTLPKATAELCLANSNFYT
jgi:glycosyltransferase involved in cell wall biosynthesis